MTILATQKNKMSWPVSNRVVGKKPSRSFVSSGQPKTEKGKSPEENQVSNTSSSCSKVSSAASTPSFSAARFLASASSRPTIHSLEPFLAVARYAGILCPHQSCLETHQSRILSNQLNHVPSNMFGTSFSSPLRTASVDLRAISLQSTHHCGFSKGSMMSAVREHKPSRMGLSVLPRRRPFASSAFSTSTRAWYRLIPENCPQLLFINPSSVSMETSSRLCRLPHAKSLGS
mmetsp:Transcript_29874/g.114682  ORF Transcript_29874/g.114682 Transcript_29874/m.114682 type:complete len:231 (-) Transcript_29874:1252-1944(-)